MSRAPLAHILWDWNGTLLDDLDLCVASLERLCMRRGLAVVNADTYRARFGFPVQDFYAAVGFDFSREPFQAIAMEWAQHYVPAVFTSARLHVGAEDVLTAVRERGIAQSVLSAYHHEALNALVNHFGLSGYFESVTGLADMAAESKLEVGRAWLEGAGCAPEQVLLVGDTTHDFEVAQALGLRCALVAGGHQARERLEATGAPVLDAVCDVPGLLTRPPAPVC